MIFAANSALTNKSSALGRFRSAKTFPELGVNSRLGTSPVLTFPPTARKLKPLPDQIQFPFRGSRFQIFCLIVCAHLPTDLRLISAKPSLWRTAGGKPVSRMSESTSQMSLRGCSGFSGTASVICQKWHKVAVEN
jgi:hypothetical protein